MLRTIIVMNRQIYLTGSEVCIQEMNMTTNRTILLAILFFALPVFLVTNFRVAPVTVAASGADDAAEYKAKCSSCHTPTAAKFFDTTKADAELVEIVMKGKKGDKPPYMPGYEAKGMTTAEASGLVTYMKGLRAAKP